MLKYRGENIPNLYLSNILWGKDDLLYMIERCYGRRCGCGYYCYCDVMISYDLAMARLHNHPQAGPTHQSEDKKIDIHLLM